jgi:hypothetical protein
VPVWYPGGSGYQRNIAQDSLRGRLSKTWVIKYRNEAKVQRKLSLGEWPGVIVVKARKLAKGRMGAMSASKTIRSRHCRSGLKAKLTLH